MNHRVLIASLLWVGLGCAGLVRPGSPSVSERLEDHYRALDEGRLEEAQSMLAERSPDQALHGILSHLEAHGGLGAVLVVEAELHPPRGRVEVVLRMKDGTEWRRPHPLTESDGIWKIGPVAPGATPEAAAVELLQALQRGETGRVEEMIDLERSPLHALVGGPAGAVALWARKLDGLDGKGSFSVSDLRVSGTRAEVGLRIHNGGRVVDRPVLEVVQRDGRWRVHDSITEERR